MFSREKKIRKLIAEIEKRASEDYIIELKNVQPYLWWYTVRKQGDAFYSHRSLRGDANTERGAYLRALQALVNELKARNPSTKEYVVGPKRNI